MRLSTISALLVGICISTVHASKTMPNNVMVQNEIPGPTRRDLQKDHKGHEVHHGGHNGGKHEDGSRNHAREFIDSLSTRSDKSKVETVEVPLGTVNTTTTASFQASSVKDGAVIFTWVDDKPEFLIGSHLASSDIGDGMTKIKNAATGKTVDRIVVQVPKSTQGDDDFKAIKEAFEGWTKTKPQHREFKEGNTYDFWATAGKKGEVGMKSA